MTTVESYYNHICNEWGVQPTSPTYTGYEHVEEQLKSYTKERWLLASEKGRQQIEDEVFDIYRTDEWFGKTYNPEKVSYWDLPWEIEAHGRECGLFIRWAEEKDLAKYQWTQV